MDQISEARCKYAHNPPRDSTVSQECRPQYVPQSSPCLSLLYRWPPWLRTEKEKQIATRMPINKKLPMRNPKRSKSTTKQARGYKTRQRFGGCCWAWCVGYKYQGKEQASWAGLQEVGRSKGRLCSIWKRKMYPILSIYGRTWYVFLIHWFCHIWITWFVRIQGKFVETFESRNALSSFAIYGKREDLFSVTGSLLLGWDSLSTASNSGTWWPVALPFCCTDGTVYLDDLCVV